MKLRNLIEKKEQSEVAELLQRTADAQRGEPERIMVRLQFLLGGGVYSFVIEHVGDLTHRMSKDYDVLKGDITNVRDKVEKTLRVLEHGYGFEREMKENLRNNYLYDDGRRQQEHKTFEDYVAAVKDLSKKYAQAHSEIPVFSKPQKIARLAAVSLGKWDFSTARAALHWLKALLEDPQRYSEEVGNITMREGMDNAFFLSKSGETRRGPKYPLPKDAKQYTSINSKRRGGAKIKIRRMGEEVGQKQLQHWVRYAGQRDFRTEEEARNFIAKKADLGTAWTMGLDDPEAYYKELSLSMPVYKTKKGWRIGTPEELRRQQRKKSRERNPPLTWKNMEIRGSSLFELNNSAAAQEEAPYEILPIKMYRLSELLPEGEDRYSDEPRERDYIKDLAEQIKKNRWFEAIYVHENDRHIVEGQHRARAAKLLGFKTVPGYGFLYDL